MGHFPKQCSPITDHLTPSVVYPCSSLSVLDSSTISRQLRVRVLWRAFVVPRFWFLPALVLSFLFTAGSRARFPERRIGTVSDTTGGRIVGATVVLINTATNFRMGRLFNNWKSSGVVTIGSGRPISATVTGDANQDGNQQRPATRIFA